MRRSCRVTQSLPSQCLHACSHQLTSRPLVRRPMRALTAALGAATLLAGCAVGPDYKRPTVANPETFRGQPAANVVSLADLPWWEVFKDPVLQDLIREALANSPTVQIAAARVQEARAHVGEAQSQFFPSIWYGFTAQNQRNGIAAQLGLNTTGAPEVEQLYAGFLTASWELDIWGRIRRSTEAARANLLASEAARRGVLLSLVGDVARAYFDLLALDVRLQIARNSTDAFRGTYNLFKDKLELGVASQLQTSRAQGALGAAQARIPEVEAQIVAKENQISILLGRTPGPIPRGTPMYGQPVTPEVPAGLPSALLERRPDLLQAEQDLIRANALVGVAKGDFFPKLNLTGLLGTASPELAAVTHGASLVWAVGAGLTGPIFQGGRILENYRAHVAMWEQTRLEYEQQVLTALREVSDALTVLAKLSQAETAQAMSVQGLEESVMHANNRYAYGLANYYEVLDAQQQLFPAQNALAQIRRDRLIAHVRLYRALGGGWSLTDVEWADPGVAANR
ncbi:MAG TPA: efflux transporter outer membrane subunit [Gemmataceae bacterium]|nr:efflux transporter outer membrane subunit [Gemmataceae bacterium]